MSNTKELNLENKIMDQVMSGKVKMRPRWYFVAGSVFSILGSVGLMIGAVFLTNLTLFLIRKQGPGIGRLNQMYDSFPLWVPFLAVFCMVIGIQLLKKYDFSYRKNFLVVTVTLIVVVIISALIIDVLGLNELWFKRGPMRKYYYGSQQHIIRKQRFLNNRINNNDKTPINDTGVNL